MSLLSSTTLTYCEIIKLWYHRNSPAHGIQVCSQLAHGHQRLHTNNLKSKKKTNKPHPQVLNKHKLRVQH